MPQKISFISLIHSFRYHLTNINNILPCSLSSTNAPCRHYISTVYIYVLTLRWLSQAGRSLFPSSPSRFWWIGRGWGAARSRGWGTCRGWWCAGRRIGRGWVGGRRVVVPRAAVASGRRRRRERSRNTSRERLHTEYTVITRQIKFTIYSCIFFILIYCTVLWMHKYTSTVGYFFENRPLMNLLLSYVHQY